MPIPQIEEFAKILVSEVRDAAIQSCDGELEPTSESPIGKRWRKAIGDADTKSSIKVVIADSVDETIFYLLQAIDQGLLRLSFTTPNGETVNLTDAGLGELSGWYMGRGGWRAMYSQERFVDDFADLL